MYLYIYVHVRICNYVGVQDSPQKSSVRMVTGQMREGTLSHFLIHINGKGQIVVVVVLVLVHCSKQTWGESYSI